jgi:RNA-directed DNA polymerase
MVQSGRRARPAPRKGQWSPRRSRTFTFTTPSTCGPTSGAATMLAGNVVFVRYADDTVAGFEYESDAKRFLADLRERLEKFALSLHPDKTRLIEFGRFAAERRARRGLGKPETFNFLGFTHICGVSRAGYFLLTRKTRRDRMRATLRAIKEALWRRLHEPIREQGQWLAQVVRGYFAYHGVPTNFRSLCAFRHHVTDLWRRSLRRRSQRDRTTWDRIAQLVAEFLPAARITHPWPHDRFIVNHPRWKPGA